jgi:hypothetical protein
MNVTIVLNVFVTLFNLGGTYINYKNGNYIWAVTNGICFGATLVNDIWMIIHKVSGD